MVSINTREPKSKPVLKKPHDRYKIGNRDLGHEQDGLGHHGLGPDYFQNIVYSF